jgi:hypothetical protein
VKVNKDVVIARLEGAVELQTLRAENAEKRVAELKEEIANLRALFPTPESKWAHGIHPVGETDPAAPEEFAGLLTRAAEVWGIGGPPPGTRWLGGQVNTASAPAADTTEAPE